MTTDVLVVLPVLDPAEIKSCVATMHPDLTDRLLVVDNSLHGAHTWHGPTYRPPPHGHPGGYQPDRNIGIARTMNHAAATGADIVVWLSTSMRFGPPGGRDLLDHATRQEFGVIGAPCNLHAFALTRAAFDLAGMWDENFYPGYYEDTDWRHRLHLAGGALAELPIDARHTRDGRGYDVLRRANPGRTAINFDALQDYYARKWGGPPGAETFDAPFGDPDRPIGYWEPHSRAELIDRYQLGRG